MTEEKITRKQVLKSLQNEIKNIKELDKKNTEENESIQENENFRQPLSIDTNIIKKILLSWGGGEDGYKLTFSKEKELLRGVYYMADWGQYEEVELNEDELNLIYEVYLFGEYPEE